MGESIDYAAHNDQLRRAAHKRWPDILADLAGLDDRQLSNRHQPCPHCGGSDRYRFDDTDGNGGYFCNQCGAGDGFSLLMKVTGWDFAHAASEVGRHLGIAPPTKHAQAKPQASTDPEAKRRRAAQIWENAKPESGLHRYLSHKGIEPHGIRSDGLRLVIPMRDAAGVIHDVQTIAADGTKRFLPGSHPQGLYFAIGMPAGVLCIAEGFATAASVHEATGYAVAVAFSADNLKAAAEALRAKLPDTRLILCADDDHHLAGNPGVTKATAAARAVGGSVAVPVFGPDRPEKATDFNDLAQLHGKEAVREAIEAACEPEATQASDDEREPDDSGDWPEPQPLTAKVKPEHYPLDALPDTIRAAVEEVAAFVKAPLPLVASSALAALSLAAQAHIDVKRAEKLQGPVGLFLLTIADSGERKTTCDGFFSEAIRQYQQEQAEAMRPALERYQAANDAWAAERDGLLLAIKEAGKKGKPADKLRNDLAQHQREKPEAPRVPRLLLADETPENLAWGLARQWPAAGVVSSEAGLIFGAHGMGKDSVMRNLALLNILWDGGTHSVGRRTSESFTVKGARLTVALQVQEATLRAFFDKAGPLARGTGFLARFLVAWPESTQGYRAFTEPPATWPRLAAFHQRITTILVSPAPLNDDGSLSPALLSMTGEAKAAWVEYHDAIESELASGGELYDVRDVASKSADNAARLAALFQLFEHGMGGAIRLDCFESASRIAAWHLSESRRFFGELALPAELADAARLDGWLIEQCRRTRTHSIAKNHARQHGPLRDGARLDAAIKELADLERLRLLKEGRRYTLALNPALLRAAP